MKNNVLENKNCLITGATGGLGQEISKEMIRHGCNLFLTGRSDKKLEKLTKQLEKTNRNVNIWYHKGDLESIDDIKNIIKNAKRKMNNVDILINCAGYFLIKKFIDNNLKDFEKSFNINIRAPYLLSKEFCKEMLEKKWGRIVNIGSSSSYAGFKETTIYCSSKHAVLGLSRAMHDELKKHNITGDKYYAIK